MSSLVKRARSGKCRADTLGFNENPHSPPVRAGAENNLLGALYGRRERGLVIEVAMHPLNLGKEGALDLLPDNNFYDKFEPGHIAQHHTFPLPT